MAVLPAPVFACTVRLTLPLPVAPDGVALIHDGTPETVHAQLLVVVTAICVVPPATGGLYDVGATVKVHGDAAATWVTVMVCPATVTVPDRKTPEFSWTVSFTVALPDPLAPCVIATQLRVDVAVHAHPVGAVTITSSVAPAAATLVKLPGAALNVQEGGGGGGAAAPPWLTVNGTPEIITVPVRAAPVFGSTLKVAGPLPDPVPLPEILTQEALLTAVHVHPAPVLTEVVMGPPAEVTLLALGASVTAQLVGLATGRACCSMGRLASPTVRVPRRSSPALASTRTCSSSLPFPAVRVTVTHGTSEAAVHEQKSSVESEIVCSPPPGPMAMLEGVRENGQLAARCVSVARNSPIATTVFLGVVLRLGSTS